MIDLRDDFDSGHLLYSMSMTNKLYDTNLLWSTYLKIVDLKVQYCKGREFLCLAPLVYVDTSKFRYFYFVFQRQHCLRSFDVTNRYIKSVMYHKIDNSYQFLINGPNVTVLHRKGVPPFSPLSVQGKMFSTQPSSPQRKNIRHIFLEGVYGQTYNQPITW